MHRRPLLLALLAAPLAGSALAQTPPPRPRRIRGTVETHGGNVLTVRTREGETVQVQLAPNYTVAAVIPATLDDIKQGVFIGTAATGPRDRLRALEVLIFPEAMRGTGEGHFPWDLQPESTMTNATVEAEVAGTDGRTLTVVARGERLTVTVPPGTPIVTFEPGNPSQLVPGAHVFIGAQQGPDGTLTAGRINVGKDGLIPPM